MKLIILFLAMFIAKPALAVTCMNDYDNSCVQEDEHSTAGNCVDLGYSTTIEKDCEHTIVCPFNSSYKRCVKLKEPTCAEKGFTLTHKKYGSCFNYSECTDKTGTHYRCDTPASCGSMGFFEKPVPNCDEDDYETCVENGKTYYLCNAVESQKSCSALGFTADDKSSWCDANSIKKCDNLSLCAKKALASSTITPTCRLRNQDECFYDDYYYIVDGGQGKCAECLTDEEGAKLIGVVVAPQQYGGYSTPTAGLVVAFDDLYFQDGMIRYLEEDGYLSEGSFSGWELDQQCTSSLTDDGYNNTSYLFNCDKSSDAQTKISYKVWKMTNSGVFTAVEGFSNPDHRHWFIPSQKQLELLQDRVESGYINQKLTNSYLFKYGMRGRALDFSGNAYRSSNTYLSLNPNLSSKSLGTTVGNMGACPSPKDGNLNYINRNTNCRVRLMFMMP